MKRNRLAILVSAFVAATAFSSFASATQITNWQLNLTGLGGGTTTNISNLAFNGESYVVNTTTANPGIYDFTDKGVFNVLQYNSGSTLNLNGGELTAVFNATGTTNTGTGVFTFAAGSLDFYFQKPGNFGTTALNTYGASDGTNVAMFSLLAGGGGSVDANGAPTSNGTVTATFSLTSALAGVWKDFLGVDLPVGSTLGFVTTNASMDNAANSGTYTIDPNLVLALSGVSGTTNNPPGELFINNGGQFKLETVPEPATLALLGIGLLGIGVGGLRRRKV